MSYYIYVHNINTYIIYNSLVIFRVLLALRPRYYEKDVQLKFVYIIHNLINTKHKIKIYNKRIYII